MWAMGNHFVFPHGTIGFFSSEGVEALTTTFLTQRRNQRSPVSIAALRAACHSGTLNLNLMLFVGGSAICANMPVVRQIVKRNVDFSLGEFIAWSTNQVAWLAT
jgi:hypothetical protein